MAEAVLTMDNPVFRTFIGYAGLVLMKTSLMSVLTSIKRIKNKAFANEEDAKSMGLNRAQSLAINPEVERIRRCHLNDLENVLPFVLLGILYVATGPSLANAVLHFRAFTISRFLHTIVYVGGIRQPARMLCFFVGFIVNLSMGYNILKEASF